MVEGNGCLGHKSAEYNWSPSSLTSETQANHPLKNGLQKYGDKRGISRQEMLLGLSVFIARVVQRTTK